MCDSVEVLWSQSTSGRGGDGDMVTQWEEGGRRERGREGGRSAAAGASSGGYH